MAENTNSSSNGNSASSGLSSSRDLAPVLPYHVRLPGPGGGGEGDPGKGISASFVANALRQWWKVATPAGVVLAAVAGVLVWYFFVPMYKAEAWLEIKSRAPYVAFPSHEDWQAFVRTQVELIRSPLVLSPVLADTDIAAFEEIERQRDRDPDGWLRERLEVKSVGQSELYTVSFEGPDPDHCKQIVDKVVESYFDVRGQDDADKSSKVIELLKDQKRARETSVQRFREAYKALYMRATGKDPFVVNANPIGAAEYPLYELENKLTTAEVEWEVQRAILAAVEETASKPLEEQYKVPDWQIEQALRSHPEIAAKERQLERAQTSLSELEAKLASTEDPLYLSRQEEVEQAQEALAELRDKKREEVRNDLEAERASKREAELARMRLQVESFDQMVQALQKQYDEKRKEHKAFSGDTVDMELAQEDYRRAQEVYERIADRIDVLETEQAAPARVILRRSAVLPKLAVEQFPLKQVAAASTLCFFLPFAFVVVWERLTRRVSDRQQLQEQARLPVIGEISRLPVRGGGWAGSSSRRFGQDLRLFEESIDSLRTNLVLSETLKGMRVLTVTSAANNEGKTSVAVQLAVSIARASGERTLLVDGDMRSPDIHKVLDTQLEPGLAEVLSGEYTLEDAIITNWGKHVHVLPAGKLRRNPHSLLGNGALRSLLDEVRASYRYAVIDTPPVLAAGEALVFAKAADAALICAMRDISRLEQLNVTHERLRAAGANPVGVVLNGVPARLYAYRYGTYSYVRD